MRICRLISIISIAALICHNAYGAARKGNAMEETVRRPAVAGQFYPGDPDRLRADIMEYLKDAPDYDVKGRLFALISPHAGYVYSGHVAACGYSLLEPGQFDTVVVISPSHVEYFPYSSVYSGDSYITPLGKIAIDKELSEKIAASSDLIRIGTTGHATLRGGRGEHSLEVQLPFLQVSLGEFKLVAIVMGDQSPAEIDALGSAIGKALAGKSALIVASTDLSHFHSSAAAWTLDHIFIQLIEDYDIEGLKKALASKETEACGGGPVAAAMIAARALGSSRCEILKYADSGDVSGDKSQVVGYVSAALLGDDPRGKNGAATREKNDALREDSDRQGNPTGSVRSGSGTVKEVELDRDDQIFLLGYARSVIEGVLTGKKIETVKPKNPVFMEKRGAFVTLKKNGQLRGCIGYIDAFKPLLETIREMAEAAAFKDYRFPPITLGEVDQIQIEISILSPIREITDPSEIVVGRDGIIITRGSNRGLLLPQVAVEWGWNREKFLDQTCVKAGVAPDAWKKPGTKIEIFSAEIFSESELGLR